MEPASNNPSPAVYRMPLNDGDVQRPVWDPDDHDRAREEQLLLHQAIWFCHLRWLVIALLSVAGIAGFLSDGQPVFGIRLSYGWPLATAVTLAIANSLFLAVMIRGRVLRSATRVRSLLWLQIIVDLFALTTVVHFIGSVETYAPFMYLFHIILACMFFRPIPSLLVATLSAVLYLACLVVESAGIIQPETIVVGHGIVDRNFVTPDTLIVRVVSSFLIWTVIWCLTSRLAGTLRRRERELAFSNDRLGTSIEERSRHMLQTTHQLKAPFATIHALTQLLMRAHRETMPDKAIAIVRKIEARCSSLSQQIQDMLQLANLRSESQSLPPVMSLDLSDIVDKVVANVEPAAHQRGIVIETHVESVSVNAAEDHMQMIIDNLITNAVNYSFDGGAVIVTLENVDSSDTVQLSVRDHGIGIHPEKLAKVFDDYYRTADATRHNDKSTGLGLAIVRQVAGTSKIEVHVQSAPGWGTCFTLTIPRNGTMRGAAEESRQSQEISSISP